MKWLARKFTRLFMGTVGNLQAYLAQGYRNSTNASERVFWVVLWVIPRMVWVAMQPALKRLIVWAF